MRFNFGIFSCFVKLIKNLNNMFNKLLFMSNSFFGRFKKRDNKVVEEHLPIREDRIFWVETLQKIAFPVLNNLKKAHLKKYVS